MLYQCLVLCGGVVSGHSEKGGGSGATSEGVWGVWEAELPQLPKAELTVIDRGFLSAAAFLIMPS